MGEAGYGAEEQASRRARRLAQQRADAERAGTVDEAVLRRARADVRRWSAGAEGERIVAETLDLLRPYGWTVLHDVRWPGRQRANLDHVAIGPGGVVVVDAKNWSGNVRMTGSTLWHGGYPATAKVTGVTDAAAAITVLLAPQHRTAVRGVLCLVGQEQEPVVADGGSTVLGRWQLPHHLLSLPVRLTVFEVAEIAGFLQHELGSVRASGSPARREPASARHPSGRRPAARRTQTTRQRARRHALGALLRLALLGGVALIGFQLLDQRSDQTTPVVTDILPTSTVAPAPPAP